MLGAVGKPISYSPITSSLPKCPGWVRGEQKSPPQLKAVRQVEAAPSGCLRCSMIQSLTHCGASSVPSWWPLPSEASGNCHQHLPKGADTPVWGTPCATAVVLEPSLYRGWSSRAFGVAVLVSSKRVQLHPLLLIQSAVGLGGKTVCPVHPLSHQFCNGKEFPQSHFVLRQPQHQRRCYLRLLVPKVPLMPSNGELTLLQGTVWRHPGIVCADGVLITPPQCPHLHFAFSPVCFHQPVPPRQTNSCSVLLPEKPQPPHASGSSFQEVRISSLLSHWSHH